MSTSDPHAEPHAALLDAIFANAPAGLAFWDRELRYRRINDALAAINGVSPEEHLGRTVPELLGTLGVAVGEILQGVLASESPAVGIEVSGETPAAPGEWRHWLASYYPVVQDGEAIGVAGIVIDVTDEHRAEEERTRLLKEALAARAHAEAAQVRAEDAKRVAELARGRTEFLAEAGRRMAVSMEYESTLQEVAEIAVPTIADWCSISVVQRDGGLRALAMAGSTPAQTAAARQLVDRWRPHLEDGAGPGRVARTGEVELIADVDDEMLVAIARSPEHLRLLRTLGLRSLLSVPLRTPTRLLGTLTLAMADSGRGFDADDAALATALAARAALHIRNAQLYSERSHIAKTLQASLLPRALPEIPHLEVAARYQAAGDQNEVGGDFYDVFPTEPGSWTALIGDVTGKGPEAAALTALARHTLRGAAMISDSPAANLAVLNRAMLADDRSSRFCTVVYARVCPEPGAALLTLASGGHPPPLVLRADGGLQTVGVAGTLVGGVTEPVFEDVTVRLETGDLMLLYTDGVTELRTRDPSDGEWLLGAILRAHAGESAEDVVSAVLRGAVEMQDGAPRDDIALVAIRVPPDGPA